MRTLIVSSISAGLTTLIAAWVWLGAYLFGETLTLSQAAYIVVSIVLILGVLYAFTRDQPEPPAAPIKERGIK